MYPIGTREGMSLPRAESVQDMGEHFSLKKRVTRVLTISKLQKFYFPAFSGEHF